MTYWPPDVIHDPRQMPELRRALLDSAHDDGAWAQMEQIRSLTEAVGGGEPEFTDEAIIIAGPTGYAPDEMEQMITAASHRATNTMEWSRRSLEAAQLIHVTGPMCDLLFDAEPTVPHETVLNEIDPPRPCGLVVFEKPFTGIDSGVHYETTRVDAVLWGAVRLPPREDWLLSWDFVHNGYGFLALRWLDPKNQDDDAARQVREETENVGDHAAWVPLGRSDWVVGDPISRPAHDRIDPAGKQHASMMEDRRLMAALWALLRQKRIVETRTVTPDRHTQKRLDRARDTTDREVQIVYLRRTEYRHPEGAEGHKITVRYPVRAHPRLQPYGPGWSKRKLIMVPGHWRGPLDGPIVHIERVWELEK